MQYKFRGVVGAARQALRQLRRGDRVSIMTFNDSTRLVSSFTDDLDSVERDIQEVLDLRFGGRTYILQAVAHAASYFLQDKRTHRRRAVLIITDNLGDRSSKKERSVIHNLWEADALLSGLIIPDRGYPVRRAIVAVIAPYALAMVGGVDHIVEQTGGDKIRSDDPGSAFPEMMRRIRSRYSLYYPTPEGKPDSFRSIRVELSPDTQTRFPEARVYARRGYRLTRP